MQMTIELPDDLEAPLQCAVQDVALR